MTCIVGLIDNDTVHLAGDSSVDFGDDYRQGTTQPKVWRQGQMVLGVSGSYRVLDVIHYNFRPPKREPRRSIHRYLCGPWVDALRKSLKEHGTLERCKGADEMDAEILLGYKGRLWDVDSALHVGESDHPWPAIGVGSPFALGALHATQELSVRVRLQSALLAAHEYCHAVSPPFRFVRGGA